MAIKTETTHRAEALVSELPGLMSRKTGTLNSGQNLQAQTVIAQILAAGVATAVGTPTGNGAITIGAAIGPQTVAGVYKLVATTSGAAAVFNFLAPDGTLIRQVTTGGGATVTDHLTVTIADGAADFAAGDTFSVTVTGGDLSQFAPAGTTGTQIPVGVLYSDVDASTADKPCVYHYRDSVFNAAELVWPAGITTDEKNAAISRLMAAGIILR